MGRASAAAAFVLLPLAAGCGGVRETAAPPTTPVTVAPQAAGAAGVATVATPPPFVVAKWHPNASNVYVTNGRLLLDGRPVAHVLVKVDEFTPGARTGADGSFAYEADATAPARHPVSVVDAAGAAVGGAPPSAAQRAALVNARGAFTVAYAIRDLKAASAAGGAVAITGRLAFRDGTPPATVVLYSYRLTGRVVDADGRPVVGARVSTRTLDRDFWTISSPTDADGRYESLFTASSERRGDPVPFTVRVAQGDRVYEFLPDENVLFRRLRSARLDIDLPPAGYAMALPQPTSYAGAVYDGVLVGAEAGGRLIRPLTATWPDAAGRFRLVLPSNVRGQRITLWQSRLQVFSRTPATPGGRVDLRGWPATLAADDPRDVATLRVPS